jgi:LDH2 family malate/lactate/ureidoglycolate dehydrogenase
MYVRDIKEKTTNTNAEPKISKETVSTALVDGKNLLGPVVGNFCMNLAINKAKETGIGMVVANRSNHYGIAGYYSMQALKHKMIVNELKNIYICCSNILFEMNF